MVAHLLYTEMVGSSNLSRCTDEMPKVQQGTQYVHRKDERKSFLRLWFGLLHRK
jgi:hypothetical protein